MNKLSAEADVDRATLSKVEKSVGVTEMSAYKILDILKNYHDNINDSEIITK